VGRLVESGSVWAVAPRMALMAILAAVLVACQTTPKGPPAAPPTGPQPILGAPQITLPPSAPQAQVPPSIAGAKVRVALLLPLSASNVEIRNVASALLDSAELAVFKVNNANLMLLPKDTGGTSAGAAAAAQAAIRDGAQLILGPLLRDEVQAVSPIAHARNIPVLAFSSDRDVAGNGVFLLSFQPEQEIKRVTRYAVSQGRSSFAALIPNSAYGQRVESAFVSAVQTAGAQVVALQSYERSPAEMSDPVKTLADYEKREAQHAAGHNLPTPAYASGTPYGGVSSLDRMMQYQTYGNRPFDAVLLPEGGTLLRALAPLLPYFDIDPRKIKVLGTGLWDDPSIRREPALIGGWFAAPPPSDAYRTYVASFRQAFKANPPRIASLSFDAVALAGALANLPAAQRFSIAELTNPNGFSGVDGIFRFTPDGDTQRGLAVMEVTKKGFRVIDPAPTTFETPTSSQLSSPPSPQGAG
jgi:branched-chain amino acid transport system substrate-binding protein